MKSREPKEYVIVERKKADGTIYYVAYNEQLKFAMREGTWGRYPHKFWLCERRYPQGQVFQSQFSGLEQLASFRSPTLELWDEEFIADATNAFRKEFQDPCAAKETICRVIKQQAERTANRDHCRIVSEGECCGS